MKKFSYIFQTLQSVLRDEDLTPLDKNVFSALLTFNGKGKIYPPRSAICERLATHRERSITESIKRLEKKYIRLKRERGKSNVYEILNVKTEMKRKPKTPTPPKDKPFIDYINKGIEEATATVVAKLQGFDKPESGHYSFVNKLVKGKVTDKYKDDEFNKVRRFIILLYVINQHSEKINPDNELPYPYFNTVYNSQIYNTVRNRIFNQPNYKTEIPYLN